MVYTIKCRGCEKLNNWRKKMPGLNFTIPPSVNEKLAEEAYELNTKGE